MTLFNIPLELQYITYKILLNLIDFIINVIKYLI